MSQYRPELIAASKAKPLEHAALLIFFSLMRVFSVQKVKQTEERK